MWSLCFTTKFREILDENGWGEIRMLTVEMDVSFVGMARDGDTCLSPCRYTLYDPLTECIQRQL